MANVLVSFSAPLLEKEDQFFCFYESLIQRLLANGNNVLVHNTTYLTHPAYRDIYDKTRLENDIRAFDPSLVLCFNNQKYERLDAIVDCPIAVWNADSLEYFAGVEDMKQKRDRYFYFAFLPNGVEPYKQIGAPANRVFVVPPATAITAREVKQDKNISFIATKFVSSENLNKLIRDPALNKRINQLYQAFWREPIYDRQEFLRKNNALDLMDRLSAVDFWHIANLREMTLINMLDLDVHIYGHYWEFYAAALQPVYAAYRHEEVYSLKHNQDIYNSSKICLNVNHPQAGTNGYAFRILDIMASNGCLVSSESTGITAFTEGFVDIPMFKNPWDARSLCQELLKDERAREDIVRASQACIDKKGRWEHRFQELQEIVGVTLLNPGARPGVLSLANIKPEVERLECERLERERLAREEAEHQERIRQALFKNRARRFAKKSLLQILGLLIPRPLRRAFHRTFAALDYSSR